MFPCAKSCIDGLVDAGVIPNDTAAHLTEMTFRPPVVEAGTMALRLEVVEVADALTSDHSTAKGP